MTDHVLILGSAPNAVEAAQWDHTLFDRIVVINNAWRVRSDWDILIHPEDFPQDRRPDKLAQGQIVVTAADYVPLQNDHGGFVYAGGTMALTAGYWALAALRPKVMAFMGCDMVYPDSGKSHFYGTGEADPLRADISLRNLEAKSARLALHAARLGCACVNLSSNPSRLVFDRATPEALGDVAHLPDRIAQRACVAPEAIEKQLGYMVESGRYWEVQSQFNADEIDALDRLWLQCHRSAMVALA